MAYRDDTQITTVTAQKRYAEIPRVEVAIERIQTNEEDKTGGIQA